FLGLDLNIVEIARHGNYFTLYANLDPVPTTKITNVTVTDLSTGDFATDSVLFDSWEWRHRNRKQVSDTGVNVNLKGMIGADACCTTGDKTADATAAGRVTFDVVPADGETWKVDLAHSIAGAHTIVSEGVGGGYGGQSRITTVTGRYRVGAGAWTNFNFNPSVMDSGWRSGESGVTYNYPFTGSNAASLTGTTAQTVTVEFSFAVHAFSDSNLVFPAEAGIEAAVRFGANDSLTNNFTAGDYPGAGNRNIVNDGYRLSIALSVI
ncbi:MAG: hypothetical protein GXY13_08450, partial [Acidimicrobiales bacterium]|nr:hypothetical protein [Acidimicrobiales bacterium]